MHPILQTSYTLCNRYGYAAFCATGLAVSLKRIVDEQGKGEKVDRRVQVYSLLYALSCALEIGLDLKKLPAAEYATVASAAAFVGGGAVRFEVESEREDSVGYHTGRLTAVMDITNGLVYLGLGPNRFSLALSLLSPAVGLGSSYFQKNS